MRHLHYQKGSCLLQNLGNFVPSVSKLATEFRNWTNHEINVNSYYTSSGAQTFKWHWDNHDVFLLQVHGKKEWEIFEPPFSFPLSHQQFWSWPEFTKKQCKPGKKLTLDEGDILYIPAGFPHLESPRTPLHST